MNKDPLIDTVTSILMGKNPITEAFKTGDKVKIKDNISDKIGKKYIGKTGTVLKTTEDGHVSVNVAGARSPEVEFNKSELELVESVNLDEASKPKDKDPIEADVFDIALAVTDTKVGDVRKIQSQIEWKNKKASWGDVRSAMEGVLSKSDVDDIAFILFHQNESTELDEAKNESKTDLLKLKNVRAKVLRGKLKDQIVMIRSVEEDDDQEGGLQFNTVSVRTGKKAYFNRDDLKIKGLDEGFTQYDYILAKALKEERLPIHLCSDNVKKLAESDLSEIEEGIAKFAKSAQIKLPSTLQRSLEKAQEMIVKSITSEIPEDGVYRDKAFDYIINSLVQLKFSYT